MITSGKGAHRDPECKSASKPKGLRGRGRPPKPRPPEPSEVPAALMDGGHILEFKKLLDMSLVFLCMGPTSIANLPREYREPATRAVRQIRDHAIVLLKDTEERLELEDVTINGVIDYDC